MYRRGKKPSGNPRFTARLKPCPSYRDAFSFSSLVGAPRQQFVQNVPSRQKAVRQSAIYGSAEAVPFIQRRFFIQFFGWCPEAAVCTECDVAAKSRQAIRDLRLG